MCANHNCSYFVHESASFGGYCCKKCHWIDVSKSKSRNKPGEMCARREAPSTAPRAAPTPPDNPMDLDRTDGGGSGRASLT